LARGLEQRISAAKHLHDAFMAATLVIDEVAANNAQLPEEIARVVGILRRRREDLIIPFDHDCAHGPAREWEAARRARRL
jgi:hypothetical protein